MTKQPPKPTEEWDWEKKERWTLERLHESQTGLAKNTVYFALSNVTDKKRRGVIVFSKDEQKEMLEWLVVKNEILLPNKLDPEPVILDEHNDFIKNIHGAITVELPDESLRRKLFFFPIFGLENRRDILLNYDKTWELVGMLRREFSVIDPREIQPGHDVATDVYEYGGHGQLELVCLLEDLGIARAWWKGSQWWGNGVNHSVNVYLKGTKAREFVDTVYGTTSPILPKTVENLAGIIENVEGGVNEWCALFVDVGVPSSLMARKDFPTTKKELIRSVLSALISTGDSRDLAVVGRILGKAVDPRWHGGDETAAGALASKINVALKHDGFEFGNGRLAKLNGGLESGNAIGSRDDANQAAPMPIVVAENDTGYFKHYKQGPRIKIGGIKTKKYRLLACLLDPHCGVHKITKVVFEAIAKDKDWEDAKFSNAHTAQYQKIKAIEGVVKELQKIKGLTGRVTLQKFEGGGSVALNIK